MKARHDVQLHLVHGSDNQRAEDGEGFATVTRLALIDGSTSSFRSKFAKLAFVAQALAWMRRHGSRMDVMYFPTSNLLTMVPALAAKRMGLPVVGRIAAAGVELSDDSPLRRALRWTKIRLECLKRFDAIVAISSQIRDRLVSMGVAETRAILLPNSVDCERFRPPTDDERRRARERLALPEGARFVVCCVGALCERKGQRYLVEALRGLPEEVHLLLVGPTRDGDADAARREAAAGGLDARRITVIGHLDDVEQAYFASDLFALVSRDEGMPNAMVEAMASGLPAIGTPISGIADLLRDGSCGTFVERSGESVRAAIAAYHRSPGRLHRHGAAARSLALDRYDADRQADRLWALFQTLTAADTASARARRC